MKKSFSHRLLKFLASLKIAVVVILGIAVISSVGTIYEAKYDAEVAQSLVYHSPYMYFILGLLCVNLIAVMVDRWPWRQHHAGFVLAHIGIIILLMGSLITRYYGIDGSMAFAIGEERRNVTIKERDLFVYGSFGDGSMQPLFEGRPDFLRHPPTPERPYIINVGSDKIEFFDYLHFAFRESEIEVSEDERDGPAIRFQLENPNINMTQWLRRDRSRTMGELDLGPARVVLATSIPSPSGRNEVILIHKPGENKLSYVIYDKEFRLRKQGVMREAETIETPWMGMKFRLLRLLPHAREMINYVKSEAASPMASSAVMFRFRGDEYWLGLNSVLKLYLEDRMYLLSYGHRQLQLSFPLKLLAFRVGKYEGTDRAASYESDVLVPGKGEVLISMNEPLKHDGFTFYQASFERDETGQPVVSILSVNHDPGRWIKYLGSLLIVLGATILFYFKRVQWMKKRKTT